MECAFCGPHFYGICTHGSGESQHANLTKPKGKTMYEIEDKPVQNKSGETDSGRFQQFILTLKDMNPKQSIFVDNLPSNFRIAISIIQTYSGRKYKTKKERNGFRVGRIS